MLTKATTPPTEISMPPVIITRLMPQAVMIRAAFAFKILKKVWGFKKPFFKNTIAPMYITRNTVTVMMRSRFVSVIFAFAFFAAGAPFAVLVFVISGNPLLCFYFLSPCGDLCLDRRSTDDYQSDNDYRLVCRERIGRNIELVKRCG